jgi:PAS domain S-box-containing protein
VNLGEAGLWAVAATPWPSSDFATLAVCSTLLFDARIPGLISGFAAGLGQFRRAACRYAETDPQKYMDGTDLSPIHCPHGNIAQMDRRLRETEALYRQLVEHQPNLICRFLPDSTLTFVNRAYAEFFGTNPETLVGKRFSEFLAPEEWATVESQRASCSPDTPSRQYCHSTRAADGRKCWHEWTDTAIYDEKGRLLGFQSVRAAPWAPWWCFAMSARPVGWSGRWPTMPSTTH